MYWPSDGRKRAIVVGQQGTPNQGERVKSPRLASGVA